MKTILICLFLHIGGEEEFSIDEFKTQKECESMAVWYMEHTEHIPLEMKLCRCSKENE